MEYYYFMLIFNFLFFAGNLAQKQLQDYKAIKEELVQISALTKKVIEREDKWRKGLMAGTEEGKKEGKMEIKEMGILKSWNAREEYDSRGRDRGLD